MVAGSSGLRQDSYEQSMQLMSSGSFEARWMLMESLAPSTSISKIFFFTENRYCFHLHHEDLISKLWRSLNIYFCHLVSSCFCSCHSCFVVSFFGHFVVILKKIVHFLVVFSSGAGGWIRSRPGKSKSVIMHASQFFVIYFFVICYFFCRYFFHFPVTTQRQQNDNKMTTLIRLIQNCKPEWQKHDNKMAKYLF